MTCTTDPFLCWRVRCQLGGCCVELLQPIREQQSKEVDMELNEHRDLLDMTEAEEGIGIAVDTYHENIHNGMLQLRARNQLLLEVQRWVTGDWRIIHADDPDHPVTVFWQPAGSPEGMYTRLKVKRFEETIITRLVPVNPNNEWSL